MARRVLASCSMSGTLHWWLQKALMPCIGREVFFSVSGLRQEAGATLSWVRSTCSISDIPEASAISWDAGVGAATEATLFWSRLMVSFTMVCIVVAKVSSAISVELEPFMAVAGWRLEGLGACSEKKKEAPRSMRRQAAAAVSRRERRRECRYASSASMSCCSCSLFMRRPCCRRASSWSCQSCSMLCQKFSMVI